MPATFEQPVLKNCTLQCFSFISSDGKTAVAAYRFDPLGPVKAVLQISHGMCEYIMRYAAFADSLAAEGIAVWGHDHLGHGATAQTADDLGFIAESDGARLLVEDVHKMTQEIRKEYPGTPLVLFGHSMGSFVARQYLAVYGEELNAAIICGTAGPQSPAGAGKIMASVIRAFKGKRHRSNFLKNVSFAGYMKTYEKGCSPLAWLTRDEAVVEKYSKDPLCMYVFTVEAYYDLFDLLAGVSSKKWAAQVPTKLPVLVISGEDDPVGSWGKGPRTVYERLQNAGLSDVKLILYPGARHEIHNETNKEEVIRDILNWIRDRI